MFQFPELSSLRKRIFLEALHLILNSFYVFLSLLEKVFWIFFVYFCTVLFYSPFLVDERNRLSLYLAYVSAFQSFFLFVKDEYSFLFACCFPQIFFCSLTTLRKYIYFSDSRSLFGPSEFPKEDLSYNTS